AQAAPAGTAAERSQGLICPNCAGVVPTPEGARIVTCPFCGQRSLVQGERGLRRWQVARAVERERALAAIKGFFKGLNKARDLYTAAEIKELFLVFLPYWRVEATVAGWRLGRVRSGKNNVRPVEIEVLEPMRWTDAAADVSEFGVHQVKLPPDGMLPYRADQLHAEGMVFEPVESPADARQEAERHFTFSAQQKQSLTEVSFERLHLLGEKLGLVYYPLWVGRYAYRQRTYQVVVDGVTGELLYGKAPGNPFYRAAMLVGGMALGTCLIVNGTLLAGYLMAESDDASLAIVFPALIGIGLAAAGYRRFRYGAEVEFLHSQARKARLAGAGAGRPWWKQGRELLEGLSGAGRQPQVGRFGRFGGPG
ncbi:MAG: hypothetical protein ACRDHL_15210, partial [Candidatus Promineifilaceae bacterium]